ncbi:MiaB/RimO family radical SAM methylthiotransferase [Novosphingobium piscinae]|uniref:MiaB/RimO family radical SAM methylthiotransferase n=1 Tax=Novosphingobium piscinae TaxID=1507448 RepID=A0A7X1FX51_9SPHN|nr:MiaB/RimO family radical SAM methylthiotransferase [Novosphingobium piscinae]MBC2668566.1 MiaB/RimO family radical SAM methylthiotransferase [Novosphingobium piscinae]
MAVQVASLGCRMNLAEGERLRALLGGADDLVVVNSCAVTAEAVRQTRQTIRRLRRANPDARLIVTGCAAETDRAALAGMSEVDGLVGNAGKLDPRAWNVPAVPPQVRPGAYTRAYVPVQNGCDHACTFCIIPQGRGPSRSVPLAEAVATVARHHAAGAAEVVLTGGDLTSWGHDLPGAPALGTLVAEILRAVPGLPRLRLSSVDGIELDPLLCELIGTEPRLMPHLHLSLQHGHDLILKRMKRRHTMAQTHALVAALRAGRPDLALGADLIAGFPTEDETMHRASLAAIAELQLVHAHIFPFSPRPGTPAARMPQLPREVVRARAAELRAAVAEVRLAWLHSLRGRALSVLAESDGTGHAENFAQVRLAPGTPRGQIVTVIPDRIVEGLLA